MSNAYCPRKRKGSPRCFARSPTAARAWRGLLVTSTRRGAPPRPPRRSKSALQGSVSEAHARARRAQEEFAALEADIAGLDAGEVDLDSEHESASTCVGCRGGADCAPSARRSAQPSKSGPLS